MKHGMTQFCRFTSSIALAIGVCGVLPETASAASRHVTFPNGLSATVYSSAELASRLTTFQGGPAIRLPDGRFVPVVTDVADPTIDNKGDGSFHPFSRELVEHVLGSIEHPNLHMEVRIYLLPYPRRGVLVSSTSGNEMFLSPHVLDIDPSVAAFIVSHELGHAFHNRFMSSSRWAEYRALRGITDTSRYSDAAPHANRPKEIFAEDFRVLFGGPEAFFDGRVENTEIASPAGNSNLNAFYLRVATDPVTGSRIAATNFPNPFNPETEIRINLSPELAGRAEHASVRVYSVTGAMVRRLHEGIGVGDMVLRWDGRDDRGDRVASGTYYARIDVGDAHETLRLVLIK